MRSLALRVALSDKYTSGQLVLLADFSQPEGKARQLHAQLSEGGLGLRVGAQKGEREPAGHAGGELLLRAAMCVCARAWHAAALACLRPSSPCPALRPPSSAAAARRRGRRRRPRRARGEQPAEGACKARRQGARRARRPSVVAAGRPSRGRAGWREGGPLALTPVHAAQSAAPLCCLLCPQVCLQELVGHPLLIASLRAVELLERRLCAERRHALAVPPALAVVGYAAQDGDTVLPAAPVDRDGLSRAIVRPLPAGVQRVALAPEGEAALPWAALDVRAQRLVRPLPLGLVAEPRAQSGELAG